MTGWGIKNKFFHTQEVCYRTMIKKVKCDNTDRLTRQAWVEETVIEITSIYLMSSVNFLKTYSILTCKRQLKFCSLPLVTTCSIYLSVLAATWGLELDKNHVFSNFIFCNELGQSDGIGNDTIDEQSRVKQFLPFLWTIQVFCDKYRNHSLMDNFSKERAIYGIYIYIYINFAKSSWKICYPMQCTKSTMLRTSYTRAVALMIKISVSCVQMPKVFTQSNTWSNTWRPMII